MPPTSNSSEHSGDSTNLERVKRTRNRIPQSCQACRKRKLKCDRQHPACENCIKRGDVESCIYVEPPEDEKTRALRARLEYLEAQVRQITSSLTNAESPTESDVTGVDEITLADHFSKLRVRCKDDRAVYYGPNSRFSIISDCPEIFHAKKKQEARELIKRSDKLLEEDLATTGFPFNVITPDSSFLNLMPERTLCDRLVVRYFECSNNIFAIVDPKLFWEEYPRIWNSPSPPNSIVSLTFLMIAIAALSLNENHELLSSISSDGQVGALKMSHRWKNYGQLALSQNDLFQRGRLTSVESVLLLCLLEDKDHVRWNYLGLLGSMARVTGLYRNPDAFRELDDHTRTIRRRLWSYLYILDQNEALDYGYPPNIAEGTFDCRPLEPIPTSPFHGENTFLYWFFKLHSIFAFSFPGVLGVHKTTAAIELSDQKMRSLLRQLPPELTVPENYVPSPQETPLEILRRYMIASSAQSYFITLHRPYRSVSKTSSQMMIDAAWHLAGYQMQLSSLSTVMEPFLWFIEDFVEPHTFRGVALLGTVLIKDPSNPRAAAILNHLEHAAAQAKMKSLRRRDYAKLYGLCRAMRSVLTEKGVTAAKDDSSPQTDPSMGTPPDGLGWDMDEILTESGFKWDEYLVEMVLDPNQNEI